MKKNKFTDSAENYKHDFTVYYAQMYPGPATPELIAKVKSTLVSFIQAKGLSPEAAEVMATMSLEEEFNKETWDYDNLRESLANLEVECQEYLSSL